MLERGFIPGVCKRVAPLSGRELVPVFVVGLQSGLCKPHHHLRAVIFDAVRWQAEAALECHQNRACQTDRHTEISNFPSRRVEGQQVGFSQYYAYLHYSVIASVLTVSAVHVIISEECNNCSSRS